MVSRPSQLFATIHFIEINDRDTDGVVMYESNQLIRTCDTYMDLDKRASHGSVICFNLLLYTSGKQIGSKGQINAHCFTDWCTLDATVSVAGNLICSAVFAVNYNHF